LPPLGPEVPIRRRQFNPTHCLHGHEYTEKNTYLHHGTKFCRTCAKDSQLRRAYGITLDQYLAMLEG
jgi:hypothetical protein